MSVRLADDGTGTPEIDLDTVSDAAAEIIRELRAFEVETHRVWLDPTLTPRGRWLLLRQLLRRARRSTVPDLACRAIERTTFAHVGDAEANPWERVQVETALVHDVEAGSLAC